MKEPLTIYVKYHADIDPLQQIEVGDAIDVRAAEDVDLKFMQCKRVSLGFSCKLPDRYLAILSARSSLFKNHGVILTNGIGIIDNTYCGDNDIWCMELVALRTDVHISKNERIGQFILVDRMGKVDLPTVETLGYEDRGGYGSTGRE